MRSALSGVTNASIIIRDIETSTALRTRSRARPENGVTLFDSTKR
jgi:hypothetical protein